MSAPTRDAVWGRLREAGVVDANALTPQSEAPAPWFAVVSMKVENAGEKTL